MDRRWTRVALGFGFWTAVGVFFSTQRVILSPPEENAWLSAFERSLPQWYLWGLIAPFVARADRWAKKHDATLARRVARHVPLSVAFVSLYIVLRTATDSALGTIPADWSAPVLAAQYHWNLLIYSVILGVLIAFDYHREAHERRLRASQLEASLAEAKLDTLEAQLQPHFLFNTLNAISAFIEHEPTKARRMTAQLGDLLRHSLEHGGRREIPLSDELRMVEDYVAIQQVRFEGKLTVDKEVPPETLDARVPSFLLQPLLENAVEHGLAGYAQAGRITLRARRVNGVLELSVSDDGAGLPGTGASLASGVGLRNTTQRLDQLYGDAAALTIEDGTERGATVTVTLPFRDHD